MERQSDLHSPRIDDAMEHEVESLLRGAPVEARIEPGREMEDAGDDEPVPESIVSAPGTVVGEMTRDDVRARSELAQSLRPSIFPARREAIVACAIDEDAPPELVARLERLPDAELRTVEEVWEALGGRHEPGRTESGESAESADAETTAVGAETTIEQGATIDPERTGDAETAVGTEMMPQQFAFRFDRVHRALGVPFGVTPDRARVEIDPATDRFVATFGRWTVATSLSNVAGAELSGPYTPPKTVGPAHVSLKDRGLTFATNDARGVCIRFREPVRGIDPFGVVRHPALTVTVDEPDALRDALSRTPALPT